LGGVGIQTSINGTPTYFAGGGSGYGTNPQTTAAAGGGGAAGASGSINTGGGGGGRAYSTSGGGFPGGSGIVILRYPGSQKGIGGTVTSAGGYTIHTFTGTGTFTA